MWDIGFTYVYINNPPDFRRIFWVIKMCIELNYYFKIININCSTKILAKNSKINKCIIKTYLNSLISKISFLYKRTCLVEFLCLHLWQIFNKSQSSGVNKNFQYFAFNKFSPFVFLKGHYFWEHFSQYSKIRQIRTPDGNLQYKFEGHCTRNSCPNLSEKKCNEVNKIELFLLF